MSRPSHRGGRGDMPIRCERPRCLAIGRIMDRRSLRPRVEPQPMKMKSPIVTLIVGLLIGVIILILSINSNHPAKASGPMPAAAVAR